MARLDETITAGQAGHISDSQILARKANYVYDVKDYGATGDGTTDDTAAIQAAIDAAVAVDGTVSFPPASVRYAVTGLTVGALAGGRIVGSGADGEIQSSVGSVFDFTGSFDNSVIENVWCRSSASGKAAIELSTGSMRSSTIRNCRLTTGSATGRAILANGSTWSMNDTLWLSNVYSADGASASVPIIELVDVAGASICNQNTFLGGRIIGSTGATSTQILIESQGSNYLRGNTFQNINSEIPVRGFLTAHGTWALALRDIGMYDAGTIAADLIVLDKHTSGLVSTVSAFDNVIRHGGTIGSFYDITMDGGSRATVVNCGGTPSNNGRLQIRAHTHVIGGGWATITGQDTTTTVVVTGGDVQVAKSGGEFGFGSDGPVVTSDAATPEGSVTAPIGSLFMRSDGGTGTAFYVKELGSGSTGWVAK